MKTAYAALIAVVAILAVPGSGPTLAQAPDSKDRTVEQYACKDIMRESGANRDVAIAFLHGYLLGKSGNSKFNLDALHKQSDDLIERCLDNPAEKAVDAAAKVKN